MTFPPFAVARYGVYVAVAIAALSVWLGHQAGASLDWALMRAVFFPAGCFCCALFAR